MRGQTSTGGTTGVQSVPGGWLPGMSGQTSTGGVSGVGREDEQATPSAEGGEHDAQATA